MRNVICVLSPLFNPKVPSSGALIRITLPIGDDGWKFWLFPFIRRFCLLSKRRLAVLMSLLESWEWAGGKNFGKESETWAMARSDFGCSWRDFQAIWFYRSFGAAFEWWKSLFSSWRRTELDFGPFGCFLQRKKLLGIFQCILLLGMWVHFANENCMKIQIQKIQKMFLSLKWWI